MEPEAHKTLGKPMHTCYYVRMIKRVTTTWAVGLLSSLLISSPVFGGPDTQPHDPNKGLTVEGLARGVKSAAQNIEKEIPKLGTAIGKTIKTITGKGSGQASPQAPNPDRK